GDLRAVQAGGDLAACDLADGPPAGPQLGEVVTKALLSALPAPAVQMAAGLDQVLQRGPAAGVAGAAAAEADAEEVEPGRVQACLDRQAGGAPGLGAVHRKGAVELRGWRAAAAGFRRAVVGAGGRDGISPGDGGVPRAAFSRGHAALTAVRKGMVL